MIDERRFKEVIYKICNMMIKSGAHSPESPAVVGTRALIGFEDKPKLIHALWKIFAGISEFLNVVEDKGALVLLVDEIRDELASLRSVPKSN